ncbi:segregation/condensation protein A [Candidatus Uhrbacteria bacterium]|nr:segregation/condensation protein A [Candidatus Uhrbacteria bacterium]
MSFEVRLETFDGPLHVLLELIQTSKLPITEVSLSKVTDDYLRYIDAHDVPASELADFLVIATRLLLIKSQAILPGPLDDEQEDATTLALQLRLYQEFVEASKHLETLFDRAQRSFERARCDVVKPSHMEIPPGVHAAALREAFAGLLRRLEPFFRLQEAAIERVVSVQERLREIHEAILSKAKLTFAHFAGHGRSRVDVVVSFLALLELVKQRVVRVVQADPFQDIEIKRVD